MYRSVDCRTRKIFVVVLLFFVIVGVPNLFVKYDQAALVTSNSIDIYKLIRILEYALILYLLSIGFLGFKHNLNKMYLKNIKLPLFFYVYYFLVSFFLLKYKVLISFYRLVEWFVFLMAIYAIQALLKRRLLLEDFRNFLVVVTDLFLVIIFLSLLLRPSMVLWKSKCYNFIRLGGYVIHPNALGSLVAMRLLHVISYEKKKILKVIIFGMVLILTFSRGAFFSFLLALILWSVLKKGKSIYIVVFLLFLFVLVISNKEIVNKFILRGAGISNFLTLSERLYVFISALILAKTQHFWGGGFYGGTYLIADIMNSLLGIDYWRNVHAHNEFLQSLCSGGIFALLFDIYIHILLFYLPIKYMTKTKDKAFCVGISLIFFLYSMAMATISWQVLPISSLFWLYFVALSGGKGENFTFMSIFVSKKSGRSRTVFI